MKAKTPITHSSLKRVDFRACMNVAHMVIHVNANAMHICKNKFSFNPKGTLFLTYFGEMRDTKR